MSVTTSCTCYSWERPAQDHAPSCPAAPWPTHPTPPPGDNGKAEAREQIARALTDCHLSGKPYKPRESGPPRTDYGEFADAVLATRAVAEWLAAVERVRALAEYYESPDRIPELKYVGPSIRQALDGQP